MPGNTVDGRREPRKSQVDLGRLGGGLGRLNGGGGSDDLSPRGGHLRLSGLHLRLRGEIVLRRVVQILLRDGLLLGQRSVAIHIQLGAALIRFRHRDLRLGLRQFGSRLR